MQVRRAQDPLPAVLVALWCTAGMVDAVSFLGLGQVFTANMTGNVAALGFGIAGAAGFSAWTPALALAAFLAGAVAGGRIAGAMASAPRRRWLLTFASIETALVAAAAVVAIGMDLDASDGTRAPVIALLAVAMGLRNATARRLAVPDLTATVLTSTLTGLASESFLAGGDNRRAGRKISAVVAMLSGAIVGALLVLHEGLAVPLGLTAAITVLVTVAYALHPVSGVGAGTAEERR